jgi:peptidoglycan/xylan/chitin deacetylase (PgdA/CDA1 family)
MVRKILMTMGLVIIALGALLWWSYGGAIVRFPVDEKFVVLTYDDGPNPPHTQALLEVLKEHDVKATFFLKGRNIEAFPELVRAVAEAGHEIGNHSYSHRPMLSFSEEDMREEVMRTNLLIENELGYQPMFFRPPYGVQGPGLKRALEELGMISIIMSDHGTDWELTDPALIAEAVLESVAPGSIVLLHDGHGDVDDPLAQDSRAATVAATGMIIQALKDQGYQFATVGELLEITEE